MNYEIVELAEKIVAGKAAVTSNSSPDMQEKIGNLWQTFGAEAGKIAGRTNKKAIGLYCDYGTPAAEDYTVLIGCQVENKNSNPGFAQKIIPAGRYAKFVLSGDVVSDVCKAWNEIWNTPLDRSFAADFEEYQEDCDGKTGTIHIYISLK